MRLIVLAAGKGARMFPLTKDTPKSLLDLGDATTLLGRMIVNASGLDSLDEIVVVTGYRHKDIERALINMESPKKLTTVYNPFYDVSNNLISLWCALSYMQQDDFIITNGDNIYTDKVLPALLDGKSDGIQLTVSVKESYDEDDMKVLLTSDGLLKEVHKKIDRDKADAESVGLVLVKGSSARNIFVDKIVELIKQKSYLNKFWLEIFNSLVADDVEIKPFEIGENDWREMDFHPDVATIRNLIVNKASF